MKKLLCLLAMAMTVCFSSVAMANDFPYLNVVTSAATQQFSSSNLKMTISGGYMNFNDGTNSANFKLTDLTKMYFVQSATDTTSTVVLADTNVVVVTYSASSATVTMSENIKSYVTATTNGAHVAITQSDKVDDTIGEITYQLSGTTTNGSLSLSGSYKATVELMGLSLTNPSGAAIDIQNGKRIKVSVKSGTTNTLTDGSNGDWKGAFQCKGHTEFRGKGTLTIYGNTKHAIWNKEYVEVKNLTLNLFVAVKDGLNCNQYFYMESGEVNIKNYADNAIQVSYKDDPPTDTEDTGNLTQDDGTINIYTTGSTGSALKYDGSLVRNGGTLNIYGEGEAVENVASSVKETIEVYNIMGMYVGTIPSVEDLFTLPLSNGVYILKTNTTTQKIVLQ